MGSSDDVDTSNLTGKVLKLLYFKRLALSERLERLDELERCSTTEFHRGPQTHASWLEMSNRSVEFNRMRDALQTSISDVDREIDGCVEDMAALKSYQKVLHGAGIMCLLIVFLVMWVTPIILVAGDSYDNNYLPRLAKANLPYNGIDFPDGPTGRFCNGRTVIDVLSDTIGLPYPPVFLDPLANGSKILRGVNYASAAGGILDETGANFLDRISMNQQITYFHNTTLRQLEAQLGEEAIPTFLSSALVTVVLGGNDYVNNYFLDTNTARQYTPEQFNILLLVTFSRQLTALYNLGFRKIYVSAVGPVGCILHQLASAGQSNCVASMNVQAQDFNIQVRSMLQNLNRALTGARFLFGEAFDSVMDLVNNPGNYGFAIVNEGCCGGGTYRGEIYCQPVAQLCINRAEYVFWDAFHLTEAANIIIAAGIYSGEPPTRSPQSRYSSFPLAS